MPLRLDSKAAAKLLRGHVSRADLHRLVTASQTPHKAHKFGARRLDVDGQHFDSTGEANRYQHLLVLERTGEIADLTRQRVFDLRVLDVRNGELVKIGEYHADFYYRIVASGAWIVEDYKHEQTRTRIYVLKKKHVEAQYGLTILESGRPHTHKTRRY